MDFQLINNSLSADKGFRVQPRINLLFRKVVENLVLNNELSFRDRLLMRAHFIIKNISLSEASAFGLDTSNVVVEKFPMIVSPVVDINLKRVSIERPDQVLKGKKPSHQRAWH